MTAINLPESATATLDLLSAYAEQDDELAMRNRTTWTARVSPESPVREGSRISLAVDATKLRFFDPETGANLAGAPA